MRTLLWPTPLRQLFRVTTTLVTITMHLIVEVVTTGRLRKQDKASSSSMLISNMESHRKSPLRELKHVLRSKEAMGKKALSLSHLIIP